MNQRSLNFFRLIALSTIMSISGQVVYSQNKVSAPSADVMGGNLKRELGKILTQSLNGYKKAIRLKHARL